MTTTITKVFRCFVCDFESENHRDILLHLKIKEGHMETLGQLVAEVTDRDIRALSPVNDDNDTTANGLLIDSVDFCDRFYHQNECTILPSSSIIHHPLNWPLNLNMFSLDVSTFKCYKCDFSTTDLRQQQKHLNLSKDSARLGSVRYAFLFLCTFPTCQEDLGEKNKKYDNLKEYSQHLYNCHLRSSDKDNINVQASAQLIDTKADPAIIDLSATYQCHLCPVSRCSLTSLHQHFKSIHSAEFFPINQITVQLDLNVEKIVESLPTISDQYSHSCYECKKDFSFCIALKKHFEEAHPDQVLDLSKAISVKCDEEGNQFLCYLCGHKHASLSQLRLHFADQHPTESFKSSRLQCQLYRCKTCDNFWTFDESRLQKHYKSQKHKRGALLKTKPTDLVSLKSQEVKVQEDNNEASSEEMTKLSESVEKVEGEATNSSKFACEPCGLEFPMKCNLIRHLNSQKHSERLKDTSNSMTTTVEEEAVDVCDLSEETETNGDKEEEEVLVCHPCNYRSSHKWNFQVHLATKKHQLLCNPDGNEKELSSISEVCGEDQVALETSTYDDYGNYDNDEEEFQCLPCEFKTRFRKTWESHINHRNHKDLLKEVEVEYKNAALQKSRNLQVMNHQEDEVSDEELLLQQQQQQQDNSNLENNIGINGVELTIVFRQSSPVSKEDEYRCSQCDFRCKMEAELNCHLQDLHNSSGAEFIDDRNCNMVGTWKCRHCPRLFSSLVSLKRHCTWKHKKTTPDPLTAGKASANEEAVIDHHSKKSEILVKCDHCPRAFNSPISLKRHCTWKHPNPVSEASDSTLSPSSLASSFFQDDHQPKFPCLFCPREFDSAMSRKRHCTWKHPEEQRRRNDDNNDEIANLKPSRPEVAKITLGDNDDDLIAEMKQFTCENCGFRGKNLKAISGHWNKKKSCRPVDRRNVAIADDPDQDSEVLEFTTASIGEQITYNCDDCSFRGASKKSLIIHISCKHRSSKATKRVHEDDYEDDSVLESSKSSPKQVKIEDSEDYSEDDDEDARELIDSIVQDIPISALSSSCKLTTSSSSSKADIGSKINSSPSRSYTMMTNVEDEIHLSEEEEDMLDEDMAEDYDEDDDDDDEDLHLFIDDDEDQVEVSQVENVANAVGKRTTSLSSSASFSSAESSSFVVDEKQIANGKETEEEKPSEEADTKATKMLYKCDHCDFSNFHQDVMTVHNLVHKQPSAGSAASDKEYNTIQEKTICMCCAHCQFKTKDFEQMMEHNKKEHPEL